MSIIGELALVRCKIEEVFMLDPWFVNNNYPMQWDTAFRLIYRRIKQGQSFDEFADWYKHHPKRDHMHWQVVKWPQNLVKFWDEFFTKEYYKPRPQKPRML